MLHTRCPNSTMLIGEQHSRCALSVCIPHAQKQRNIYVNIPTHIHIWWRFARRSVAASTHARLRDYDEKCCRDKCEHKYIGYLVHTWRRTAARWFGLCASLSRDSLCRSRTRTYIYAKHISVVHPESIPKRDGQTCESDSTREATHIL